MLNLYFSRRSKRETWAIRAREFRTYSEIGETWPSQTFWKSLRRFWDLPLEPQVWKERDRLKNSREHLFLIPTIFNRSLPWNLQGKIKALKWAEPLTLGMSSKSIPEVPLEEVGPEVTTNSYFSHSKWQRFLFHLQCPKISSCVSMPTLTVKLFFTISIRSSRVKTEWLATSFHR